MEEYFYPVIGGIVTAVGGTVITALFSWMKNLSFVRRMNLETFIDDLAEMSINYAEALGRKLKLKGDEKFEKAKEHFAASLKKKNFKIEDIDARIEAVFNKIKPLLENK